MGKFNPFLYYRKCSKKEKEKGHQSKFNTYFFSIIFATLVPLSHQSLPSGTSPSTCNWSKKSVFTCKSIKPNQNHIW